MAVGRIRGVVTCVELASGPLVVAAHSEPASGAPPASQMTLPDGPGEFAVDVPAGRWWLQATLEQPSIPGVRGFSAWSREAVDVAAGETVEGIEIVVEVPETVR
jgi:hypothetical protein